MLARGLSRARARGRRGRALEGDEHGRPLDVRPLRRRRGGGRARAGRGSRAFSASSSAPTARAASTCICPPGLAAADHGGDRRERPSLCADERPRGVQVRDAGARQLGGERCSRRPGWRSRTSTSTFRTRPTSGSSIMPWRGSGSRRKGGRERRSVRQHVVGFDPARACGGGRGRAGQAGRYGADDGNGRRADMGVGTDAWTEAS